MGGDEGVPVAVPATLSVLDEHPWLRALLVGDQTLIEPLLQSTPSALRSRIEVVHTTERVDMGESPASALRNKKRSSMRIAIELVRDGRAAGCVSAGNTGALMAIAGYCLNTIESIERPAILARLPRENGQTLLVDAGANVESNGERLHQFALMGAAVASALAPGSSPRVALLNVGTEDNKGNDRIRAANELMRGDPRLNYTGYVEGGDLFLDKVDVVVCDGFVGNVVIKTSEGMVRFMMGRLTSAGGRGVWGRLAGWVLKPLLRRMWQQMDPGRYNGATLVGVKGVVVKSHGAADSVQFSHAIRLAVEEVHRDLPRVIEHWLG